MSAEMRPLPSLRRPLRLPAEDGFTLIELLVAILVLTDGLLGLIGAFDSARKLNLLSERRTSMAHQAQLEIERLQAIPYEQLAMKSPPSHSTEETNPDFYVKEGGTEYQYGAASTEAEKVALEASKGVIEPSPSGRKCPGKVGACEWEDGPVNGNVYDFVTWHKDTNAKCTKTENYKRLTVVVTAKVPSGNHQPAAVRVSTLIANPKETKKEFEEC
jgi:prepilin-type N-terminal cleavage/methylation domain-containing protein